jgi:hypothetical protein
MPLLNEFSSGSLREYGFAGFLKVDGFGQIGFGAVPSEPGVYVALREPSAPATFLPRNPGGRFKGKDPTLPPATLKGYWVDGSPVLYVGSSNDLRRRLREFVSFGQGKPVGHWGGRASWQVERSHEFVLAWKVDAQYKAAEQALLDAHVRAHGRLPFANLKGT